MQRDLAFRQNHLNEFAEAAERAASVVLRAYERGNQVLIVGNGGSAAIAQHLAAEFVGRFRRERAALPAIALTTDTSALTAIGNDYGIEQIFARQVSALGKAGDVLILMSTSGNSPNVLAAARVARERGLVTMGWVGESGKLAGVVDFAIRVPTPDAYLVQEIHLAIGHVMCEIVEAASVAQEQSLSNTHDSTQSKLRDWDTLLQERAEWRAQHNTVVWTNGCFDIIHAGHVESLQASKRFGDILIVGINSDASVTELKGAGRPILAADLRAQMLGGLACVDRVVIFDELTPEAAITRLKPDVHVKGADYAPPHGKPIPEKAIVEAYGGRVEFLPLVPALSTSDIIQKIQSLPNKSSEKDQGAGS